MKKVESSSLWYGHRFDTIRILPLPNREEEVGGVSLYKKSQQASQEITIPHSRAFPPAMCK